MPPRLALLQSLEEGGSVDRAAGGQLQKKRARLWGLALLVSVLISLPKGSSSASQSLEGHGSANLTAAISLGVVDVHRQTEVTHGVRRTKCHGQIFIKAYRDTYTIQASREAGVDAQTRLFAVSWSNVLHNGAHGEAHQLVAEGYKTCSTFNDFTR